MILTPEQVQKMLASMISQRDVVGKSHMALQSFNLSALPAEFATQFTVLKAQVDAHLATLPPTDTDEVLVVNGGEELDSVSRGELELAESLGRVVRWSAPAEEAPEASGLVERTAP